MDESTALHSASGGGHKATVLLLLDRGASIGTQDFDGGAALRRAAANNHETTVVLLRNRSH